MGKNLTETRQYLKSFYNYFSASRIILQFIYEVLIFYVNEKFIIAEKLRILLAKM